MQQPGFLRPNDDVEMQPVVAHNHGPLPMRFTSYLEIARPDLEEHDDSRNFIIQPGQRRIIPHGYFKQQEVGKGTAHVVFHLGKNAPELKGYRRAYKIRVLVRPWYKKFSDFFSRD